MRRLRLALAWIVYLGVLAGVGRLYQSRVTSADSLPNEAKPEVAAPTPTPMPPVAEAPAWIAKLDAMTKSAAAPAELCRRLRELWPSLPEDGQLEAVRRLVNLVPDGDYEMIRDLAATESLPTSAWEIVATDALTRPSPANLPVLLEVLVHGPEPVRSEAKAELLAQLGGDYGDDWARWKEEIQRQRTKPE
jgi:hypothetical protein